MMPAPLFHCVTDVVHHYLQVKERIVVSTLEMSFNLLLVGVHISNKMFIPVNLNRNA